MSNRIEEAFRQDKKEILPKLEDPGKSSIINWYSNKALATRPSDAL